MKVNIKFRDGSTQSYPEVTHLKISKTKVEVNEDTHLRADIKSLEKIGEIGEVLPVSVLESAPVVTKSKSKKKKKSLKCKSC